MEVIVGMIVSALVVYIGYNIAILRLKFKMHRKEKSLLAAGLVPYGSEVRQSIKLNEKGDGVVSSPTKSLSWYAHLVQ